MNVRLLRRIKKQILAEPNTFRMDVWSCGTAHCIGGWAAVLTGWTPRIEHGGIAHSATKGSTCWDIGAITNDSLDIDTIQRVRLTSESRWPDPFRGGRTRKIRAELAAARIEHFIKTKGEE